MLQVLFRNFALFCSQLILNKDPIKILFEQCETFLNNYFNLSKYTYRLYTSELTRTTTSFV